MHLCFVGPAHTERPNPGIYFSEPLRKGLRGHNSSLRGCCPLPRAASVHSVIHLWEKLVSFIELAPRLYLK